LAEEVRLSEPDGGDPFMSELRLLAKKGSAVRILRQCTHLRSKVVEASGGRNLSDEDEAGLVESFLKWVADWRAGTIYVQVGRDLIGLTDRSPQEQLAVLSRLSAKAIDPASRTGRLILAADRGGVTSGRWAFNNEYDILASYRSAIVAFLANDDVVAQWRTSLNLRNVAGPVEDKSSRHVDVLAESAKLRARLDPKKVAKALPRTPVVDVVVAASGVTTETDALPRVLAIRGDAGAGKTVIIGQVYDRLVDSAEAVALVIPCEMMLASPQNVDEFDSEFGRLVGGEYGLVSSVQSVVGEQSLPVLVLFDTLDYLLSTATRPSLVQLFERLHAAGATVVFSCRRHDYNVMLRPENIRLGPVAPYSHSPLDVPPLSDAEIIEIAKSYLTYHDIQPPMGSEQFAANILSLAADRAPLRNIVTNPLLLVMLCDTFASTGVVPKDLTTTRLCATYQREKITTSRKHSANTTLARTKRRLWQEIAGEMWNSSGEHLVLMVPETIVPDDERSQEAYHDLLSEEVLAQAGLDGLRIKFSHQVLAEYSIAIYLRDAAPSELERLLRDLRSDPNARWYGWQIARHLMAVADGEEEAEHLLAKLDLSQPPAFRAAAFGLAEQRHSGLLKRLAEQVVYTNELLEALPLVPDEALPEALEILVDIMKGGQANYVSAAAAKAGWLVVRGPDELASRAVSLLEAIGGIQAGKWAPPGVDPVYSDELIGSIMGPATDRQLALPDSVLAAARKLIRNSTPKGTAFRKPVDLLRRA
jgi:hypothetical protein